MGCGKVRPDRFSNLMKSILLGLIVLTVAVGCKKSQPNESAPAPAPENASTASPTPVPANSGPSQPGAQAPATPTVDTTKAITDVNAALKNKDYKKATDSLLAVQRLPNLTDQQAAAVHGQMVELQKAVAAGLANGDPNAKAAADQLRAQASGH
jgi:hypothetical protein